MVSETSPARNPDGLWTRPFVTVVVAQMAFGYAGSTFLLLPKYLATHLHASPSQIGHVTAIPALAAVIAIPFVGGFIDRIGRKPMILLGCALSASYAGAWLFVDGLGLFVDALQVLGGVAFMVAFNAAGTLVADQAPAARLGQAIGVFGAANMAMSAIAPAVAELLAVRAGWNAAFGLALLVAIASLLLASRIHEAPRTRIASKLGSGLVATYSLTRRLLPQTIAMTTCGAAYGAVFTYYQPFVLAQGATQVSAFFVGFTLAAVATRVFFGSLPDRIGRRRAALGSFVAYACTALAMTQLTPARLLPLGFVFGCAHGIFYPALSALCVEQTSAAERGLVMTLVMGAFRLGNMTSSLLFGWIAERNGYPVVFVLASAAVWLGVIALYLEGQRECPSPDPSGV
jgi:MFS family permease